MELHIGCSGWFYWHWRGQFYPDGLPTKDWFRHYTGTFNTVELNAPFYSWPRPATVRNWKRDAPPNFRTTVKVNQQITHERRMVRTQRLIDKFCGEIADTLGPTLGCFLFQFPPSYKYTPARLKTITQQIGFSRRRSSKIADRRSDKPTADANPIFDLRTSNSASQSDAPRCAVEFRHKSWWRQSVYKAFAKHHLIFCAVSAPRLPEDLPAKAEILYVRMHGKTKWYRYDYSVEELTTWARRIAASKAREVWVYFNNDREGNAIRNALELKALLQERL